MKKQSLVRPAKQPDEPKFRAINQAIKRKIQQRKTANLNDSDSKDMMHHGNEFCLCCSRIFKEGQSHSHSPAKAIETVKSPPRRVLAMSNQLSLTVYLESKATKRISNRDLEDLNTQNLRLIEANMKFWDDYRRIKEGIQRKIMSCRLHVENYDSVKAKNDLDGIQLLLAEEPSETKPIITTPKTQKAYSPEGKGYMHQQLQFYETLVKTLESIICEASEQLFPQTKYTLQSNQYFSVEQFHRDVKQLCAAKFTTDNLDKIVDMSLKQKGATIHFTAEYQRSEERPAKGLRKDEVERLLGILHRTKKYAAEDPGLAVRIEEEMQRLEREYDIEPRERMFDPTIEEVRSAKFFNQGFDQLDDQRHMLYAQARVIQSFLEENFDRSAD